MKNGVILILFFCLSFGLYQGNAEGVIGIPDVTQAATLVVPLMEKGISSVHNTLTVVSHYCGGTQTLHWQLWDINGNPMTGLSGNQSITGDQAWVSDFATILSGASAGQLTQLTQGSFYRGFMTIDLVTASTSLLPTDASYPFNSDNCITGHVYYASLLEGAVTGIPMVHIQADATTCCGDYLHGFYQFGDDREEIDTDARYVAQRLTNNLPWAADPNNKLDFILSRVYGAGNGDSRIVVWTWGPAAFSTTDTPSMHGGPFFFVVRDESGAVTTNTTVPLNHVVNVIDVPGNANGIAWIGDVPADFEVYAFSFNNAEYSGNADLKWRVLFESTIIPEWLP